MEEKAVMSENGESSQGDGIWAIVIFCLICWALSMPYLGYRTCQEQFFSRNPGIKENIKIVSTMWMRARGNKLVSGFVFQPYNMGLEPQTIVCIMDKNQKVEEIEYFEGKASERFKEASDFLTPFNFF